MTLLSCPGPCPVPMSLSLFASNRLKIEILQVPATVGTLGVDWVLYPSAALDWDFDCFGNLVQYSYPFAGCSQDFVLMLFFLAWLSEQFPAGFPPLLPSVTQHTIDYAEAITFTVGHSLCFTIYHCSLTPFLFV